MSSPQPSAERVIPAELPPSQFLRLIAVIGFVAFLVSLVYGVVLLRSAYYYQHLAGIDLITLALAILVLLVLISALMAYARRRNHLVVGPTDLTFNRGTVKQRLSLVGLTAVSASPLWLGSRWMLLFTYEGQPLQQAVFLGWRPGPWITALLYEFETRGVKVDTAAQALLRNYDPDRSRFDMVGHVVSGRILWTKATTILLVVLAAVVFALVSFPDAVIVVLPLVALFSLLLLPQRWWALGPQWIRTDGRMFDHWVWWSRGQVDLDALVACSAQQVGDHSVLLVGDSFGRRAAIPMKPRWTNQQEWGRVVLEAYQRSMVAPTDESVNAVRMALGIASS